MIVCSPKAVSPREYTVEETDGRDDDDWVSVVLWDLENHFGKRQLFEGSPWLSSCFLWRTCSQHADNIHRSHAQSTCDAISGICARSVSRYVSSDSTPERDHGRLFLSSLPSPVHRMPLYSEDGKSSGSALSEDGRGGTEPVSTIHSRPLYVF